MRPFNWNTKYICVFTYITHIHSVYNKKLNYNLETHSWINNNG